VFLVLQAAYQEVQAFAKYGGAGAKSVAAFNTHKGSSGGAQPHPNEAPGSIRHAETLAHAALFDGGLLKSMRGANS
jgi:hypothetical protein